MSWVDDPVAVVGERFQDVVGGLGPHEWPGVPGMLRRGHVQADHATCGLRPKARQIRDTDDCDSPVSAAIVRVDQCVSWPGPFSVSVRVTSTSTCSSVIFRGAPGRAASPSAPIRPSMNRTRQLRTVSRDAPVRLATRVSGATRRSSAQARTTRARSPQRLRRRPLAGQRLQRRALGIRKDQRGYAGRMPG